MPFDANVLQVAVASPGDLMKERSIVREAIFEWNAEFSETHKVVFLPRMWEFDSVPDMQKHAQESLNEQIIYGSDMLICLFWTRLGTPTSRAASGTVEEMQAFMKTDKPVALYFSQKRPDLRNIDTSQLEAVRKFRDSLSGLHHDFKSASDLKAKITKYLTSVVQKVSKPLSTELDTSSKVDLEPEVEGGPEALPPVIRESFLKAMNQALMANADGFWLSIVCDYGRGYEQFTSSDKDHVTNWALRLANRTAGATTYSAPVGADFVRVTIPQEDVYPTNFSCLYVNDGVVKVQWRGDGEAINLAWLLVRCILGLKELVNSPMVKGRTPVQIGFSISNVPKQGIKTSGVFESQSTRTSFQSLNCHWTSQYGDAIEVDKFIRDFVYKTLSEWGYKYFEEAVNSMPISNSLQTLAAISGGWTYN